MLSQKHWYRGCRWVLRIICLTLFRVRADGLNHVPPKGGALVVANHQSFLDPMFAGYALQREMHYMARDSLFRSRFFGALIRSVNAFPVKRATADIGAIKESLRLLKKGNLVLVFPEGTRTRDGSIGPLQPGAVMIACKARVPVVPVAIDGSFNAWPRHRIWPNLFVPVRVIFGAPVPAEDLLNDDGTVRTEQLQQQLVRLQGKIRKR